jgi:AraC-like DNA-binding protein
MVPAHSRLYHLEPVGIGTPYVESLTSYVARLAAAHSVHPRNLLLCEVAPYLNALSHAKTDELKRGAMSRLLAMSVVWNGTTASANSMVQGLVRLSGRSDLHFLTLLPFSEVFSQRKLLRRSKAWCSRCFETWREAKSPIYEPLLWCLESVSICHVHGQRLQLSCPSSDCARMSPPLGARSQPGYCLWCNRWLGAPFHWHGSITSYWVNEEWKQQQWVGKMLGEVLATAPALPEPLRREKAMMIISAYVNETMNGKHTEAARQLGLTPSTLRQWIAGTAKVPSKEASLVWKLPASEPSRRPFRKFDAEALQKILQEAVQRPEEPPLSLSKLAQRLGYHSSFLSRYFPELCQSISSHYQEYQAKRRQQKFQQRCEEVYQAMHHLRDQGLHPSEHRVREILKSPSILRLPEIRTAWKTKLLEMGFV